MDKKKKKKEMANKKVGIKIFQETLNRFNPQVSRDREETVT